MPPDRSYPARCSNPMLARRARRLRMTSTTKYEGCGSRRRFQPKVEAQRCEETVGILRACDLYSSPISVVSSRIKAIDLVTTKARARLHIRRMTAAELRELRTRDHEVRRSAGAAIDDQDFERRVAAIRSAVRGASRKRRGRRRVHLNRRSRGSGRSPESQPDGYRSCATPDETRETAQRWEDELHKRVIGQDERSGLGSEPPSSLWVRQAGEGSCGFLLMADPAGPCLSSLKHGVALFRRCSPATRRLRRGVVSSRKVRLSSRSRSSSMRLRRLADIFNFCFRSPGGA